MLYFEFGKAFQRAVVSSCKRECTLNTMVIVVWCLWRGWCCCRSVFHCIAGSAFVWAMSATTGWLLGGGKHSKDDLMASDQGIGCVFDKQYSSSKSLGTQLPEKGIGRHKPSLLWELALLAFSLYCWCTHPLSATSLFQQCHQHCSLVNHRAPCQGILYVLLPLRLLHLHWRTTRHHRHRPCRRHLFQQQHHQVLNLPQFHPAITVHDIIKAIPFPVCVIAVALDERVDTRLLALLTSLLVSYINVKQVSASLCSNMVLLVPFRLFGTSSRDES